VGHVSRIVKLDYNSLYPSVILTWNLMSPMDFTHIMNHLLDYILTNREKFKNLKGEAGDKVDELKEKLKTTSKEEAEEIKAQIQHWKEVKSANDKKQLPFKVLANSFFGSLGGPSSFPHAELNVAEATTCIGRQSLRLMIYHFSHLSDDPDYNYEPIVGDSVSGDTPLFIKYDDTDYFDIMPISEMVRTVKTDALGREYDTSEKPYKVLCRSGWVKPEYIYRHKTDKAIYEVSDGNSRVTVTEDHSLFNSKQEKIKPTEITEDTELEYYNGKFEHKIADTNVHKIATMAKIFRNGYFDRVPYEVLNVRKKQRIRVFLDIIDGMDESKLTKTAQAGLLYLRRLAGKDGSQSI
jgi:hypothetical protein